MLRLLTALLGPIFAKEMIEISRRARYYFNRVFYGSALLIATIAVWEDNYWKLRRGTRMMEVMAELANQLFLTVSCLQCAAVFLFVPIFLCGVIASEREERTLDLLFTTSLTDREIVTGKLASRLAVLFLMIASVLPVMSLLMLFGGIDPMTLWRVEVATMVMMIYTGAHAIYFSATSRSPMASILRTYWWLGLWLLAMPGFIIIILANTTPSPFVPVSQFFLSFLACVNPIAPFFLAIEPRLAGMLTSKLGAWASFLTAAVPLAWSGFLIVQAVRHLRMMPAPKRAWRDRMPGIKLVRRALGVYRAVHGAVDRCMIAWRRGAEVSNPLWQRARLAPVYDRDGYMRRIASLSWLVACAFLTMIAVVNFRELFRDNELPIVFLAFVWFAVSLLTLVISANSLVGDRRRGMLELMLAAPIEPSEFIDGSLRAIWEHLRRVYFLPVLLTGLFCLFGRPELIGSACSLITGTLFFAVLIAMGAICSLTARSTPLALAVTFMFPLVVLIGPVLITLAAEEGAGPVIWMVSVICFVVTRYWTRRRVSAVAVGCHLIAVHLAMTALAASWTYDARREEFPMFAAHPGVMTLITLDPDVASEFRGHAPWYVVVPIYWLALAANLFWMRRWAIANFDRLTERVIQHPGRTDQDLIDRVWLRLRSRLHRTPQRPHAVSSASLLDPAVPELASSSSLPHARSAESFSGE